jgi:hypothetical protein
LPIATVVPSGLDILCWIEEPHTPAPSGRGAGLKQVGDVIEAIGRHRMDLHDESIADVVCARILRQATVRGYRPAA